MLGCYFINGEVWETQRGGVTCPGSHSIRVVELGCGSQACVPSGGFSQGGTQDVL